MLTGGHADDAVQAPDLLRQVEGHIASVQAAIAVPTLNRMIRIARPVSVRRA